MRVTWVAAAAAAALALLASGCSSSTSAPANDGDTAARVLHQFDVSNGHAGADEGMYGTEVVFVQRKCTNSVKDVARFVENSYSDLTAHGVSDETALTLLKHLEQSIPDGSKMDCQDVLAAYLTLRES